MNVTLKNFNETHVIIDTEPGVLQELYELLSFEVKGAKFMPIYKKRLWDGYARLLNIRNKTVGKGLAYHIKSYCEDNGYIFNQEFSDDGFSEEIADAFIKSNKIHSADGFEIELRDYQIDSIKHGIRNNRSITVSVTGSGKSAIIASLIRFYHENTEGKCLLICPTTSLVEQLYSDIGEYFPDWDHSTKITRIYSGMEREDKRIIISTWQSLYDKPTSYFDDIEVLLGDECHLYSAKEVSKLFEKCVNAIYRHGFTGTLSGEKIHQLQLEGIFGKSRILTTTSELIKKSQLSDFKINALVLSYSDASRKASKDITYEEEVKFLIGNDKRNRFIAKLAASTKGNTLVLFSRVETHGELIYNLIQKYTDRPVYFVYGGTDVDIREDVRKQINDINDGIIVASSQIFSTGINIPSLQNIIFTHPSKSKIRVLQSIGRVLRLSANKVGPAILFDIVDDLQFRNKKNFSMKHFLERAKIYVQENFNYKIINVDLEK